MCIHKIKQKPINWNGFYVVTYLNFITRGDSFDQYTFNIRVCRHPDGYVCVVETLIFVPFAKHTHTHTLIYLYIFYAG